MQGRAARGQQSVEVIAIIRETGGREAGRDPQFQPVDARHGLLDDGAQARRQSFSLAFAGVRQYAQEFLPAPAADQIARPQLATRDLGHPAQYRVAMLFAVAVVDDLEAIDVEQDEAQWPTVAGAERQLGRERVVKFGAVQHAGQRIGRYRRWTGSGSIHRATSMFGCGLLGIPAAAAAAIVA
jgi:hypothetical protein